MIELGCFDPDVSSSACEAYCKEVERITRVPLADVVAGADKLVIRRAQPSGAMTVAQVQQGLKDTGFFPGGGVDGICGYRTLSAMRLFQEYVRSVEKLDCLPDGRFGPQSQQHLKRWLGEARMCEWALTAERWRAGTLADTEYGEWLALLERVKAHHTASPTRVLQKVNDFNGASDTRKVAQWDFAPAGIHLVGIRRSEFSGKFDDVFVLLTKGLVFKFQGSTEPGATRDARGLPFIVPGQHDYHFGWHQRKYLALRPQGRGVLVVRSKNDKHLDDADLAGGLEPNASINIHWGGKGMTRDVNAWSEGCQVINGTVYLDDRNELVDCSAFTATNAGEVASDPKKTRGAYNVLVDLVTALSGDVADSTVKYMLLTPEDLALGPELARGLDEARQRVVRAAG